MNTWASTIVALTLIAVAGDREEIRKDKAALQGTWKVIASVQDGDRVRVINGGGQARVTLATN